MPESKMPHPGHDKHLCYLTTLGFQVSNPADYEGLVQNGKFWCRNCGRVAAEEKNLCSPIKMQTTS